MLCGVLTDCKIQIQNSKLSYMYVMKPFCFHNTMWSPIPWACRLHCTDARWSLLLQIYTQYKTRNSSGDEIANVNYLYDDIVHVLQNTINSCINSATDRRGYVSEHRFNKLSEMTQYNGHYAVQGHSRSPILVSLKSNQIKSNLFALVKMHNKQFIKITFHLAGQTGDSFALMSAHKN